MPHIVAFWPDSVREAYPLVLLNVRRSNRVNLLYRVAAPSLFISMSFRSNSTPHTPFLRFVYHRSMFVLRSKNLTSPLS